MRKSFLNACRRSLDPSRTVVGWDIHGEKSPTLLKWITQSFDAHISEK
jgi:hypothetical protein